MSLSTQMGVVDHELLYGFDSSTRVVAVDVPFNGSDAFATIHRRSAHDASVTSQRVEFNPFFLLRDAELLRGFARGRFRIRDLDGPLHYRHLATFENWSDYREGLSFVNRTSNPDVLVANVHTVGGPVQQFLLQSGMTCFKEMSFDSIHRMQLDIEVYSSRSFPNAERAEDEVIVVALSDNRGWSRILHSHESSEKELLRQMVKEVASRDPDVLEGHNIFRFDLPYLASRCRRHGVPLALGRDGREPRTYTTSMRFAERSIEFTAYDFPGRHVIDTFLLLMNYDVTKRNLPGYGLKAAARYFGIAPSDRTYIPGSEIGEVWRREPEKVLRYAKDDVIETEALARRLSGSAFYLTQMLPLDYQHVARSGPGIKIESLMLREYLRQRHSIPAPREPGTVSGGYTDVFFTGVAGPIVYADVESLYPSIMLRHDIRPSVDTLNVFTKLLRRLTSVRLQCKEAMKRETDESKRSELDARQSSYKVLINAFYGYLGFGAALFNDFAEADRVTRSGRDILRTVMSLIVRMGGTIIEVDTDGVYFVPPAHIRGASLEMQFVKDINQLMPSGIVIGFDGRYEKMLSYKMKNYALRAYDGTLQFTGSSLVSRANERFGRRFVRAAVEILMDSDFQGLHDLYLKTRHRIVAHDWEGAEDFCKTETIKDTPDQYLSDVRAGRRTRSAAYELAIRRAESSSQPVRKGDRVQYYIGGTGAVVTAYEKARLVETWDNRKPDENTAYYVRRLDEIARKFGSFFDEPAYRLIFSPEDMFGFAPDGIEIRSTSRPPATLEAPETLPVV